MKKMPFLSVRSFAFIAGVFIAFTGLSGCESYTLDEAKSDFMNTLTLDRSLDKTRQDYRSDLAPEPLPPVADDTGAPLDFEAVIVQEEEDVLPMPLVSISVNQDVALRDVLYELADQAEVDLELDPNIEGSIIFTAREKPFDQVVRRIANLAGLRYHFEEGVLRVEEDMPYLQNYNIDYVGVTRKAESDISANISVLSGEGADTGSGFSVESVAEATFWEDLAANLEYILRSTMKDQRAVRSTRKVNIMGSAIPAVRVSDLDASQQPTAPQEVPITEDQETDEDEQDEEEEDLEVSDMYVINRQAGIISVYANSRQQKQIKKYLQEMQKRASAQVLIEAKVLEVSLADEFSSGIQWDTLFSQHFSASSAFSQLPLTPSETRSAAITISGGDFSIATDFVQRFGTVRTLSSPRLTVLHNQMAVLNVSENRVFFDIEIETETLDGGGTLTTIESDPRNIPEGLIINVLPSINLDNQEISMTVRPTLTRVTENIPDPAAAFQNVDSTIPQIAVQEIDSMVRMKSGEVIVMGGLMQEGNDSAETGIPVLSEIPIMGYLFKAHRDEITKKELVVLIKATILENDATSVHPYDRELYNRYSNDRRPFRM